MRKPLIPTDGRYLDRCEGLERALACRPRLPAIMIVDCCRMVLNRAFGSPWKAIWWLTRLAIAHDYDRAKSAVWWSWQRRIRRRTDDEITELLDAELERATGCDFREWPNELDLKGESR